ncbi:Hypothetical protein BAMTRB_014 [Escherichia phage vB_Eco_Bam]|uniref:Uncharacterized protein n=1 Tax=Escherichia phage vB_Eco_Bam TaxID=2898833 RepID=A0A9P0YBP2_9CAUD|nr:Hypothetical protein BAMTRB_014 [Escherichia phage vB_Eco_Bam]
MYIFFCGLVDIRSPPYLFTGCLQCNSQRPLRRMTFSLTLLGELAQFVQHVLCLLCLTCIGKHFFGTSRPDSFTLLAQLLNLSVQLCFFRIVFLLDCLTLGFRAVNLRGQSFNRSTNNKAQNSGQNFSNDRHSVFSLC